MIKRFTAFLFLFFICFIPFTIFLAAEEPASQDETSLTGNEDSALEAEQEEISVAEVVEGASGVRVQTMCTNCNIANVTMLGQTGDRVQIWKDGLPVVGGLGAIYTLSVMPSEAIASTEIIRGAGTVLSGSEAGTGAIFINTKAPEKRPYLLVSADTGGLNWFGQKLMGYGQLGRFGGEVIFTHSQSDASNPNNDLANDLAAFHRTTYGTTLTYKIFERSTLRLDALRYREDQRDGKGAAELFSPELGLASFYSEDIDIRKDEYNLSWDLAFKDGSKITLRGLSSYREQDTSDSNIEKEQPYMFVDETARNAEARYERIFVGKHVFKMGFAYRNFIVHGTTTESTGAFAAGQDILDQIRQDGVYSQMEFALSKKVNLTAGLRYDKFQLNSEERALLDDGSRIPPRIDEEKQFLPRLRLDWKATKSLRFNLSAGESFIAPRPFFERVCCGITITLNNDIKPQTSRDYLLDTTFIPRPWMKYELSLFQSDIENYIQRLPFAAFVQEFFTGIYNVLLPNFTQVNYEHVDLKGAEFSTEFRFLDRLFTGFEVSRVKAESKIPTIYLNKAPLFDLPKGQIPYMPEDQGSAFIRWDDQKRGFNVSAQAQYMGSMRIQMIDETDASVDNFVDTRAYWVFNFRVEARFYNNFSVFAGMDNTTNEYQDWLGDPRYEYNWGQLRGRYIYFGVSFEL